MISPPKSGLNLTSEIITSNMDKSSDIYLEDLEEDDVKFLML